MFTHTLQDKWLGSTRLFKHLFLFSDTWFSQHYYTISMMVVMLTMKGLGSTVVACSLQVRGVAGSNTGKFN